MSVNLRPRVTVDMDALMVVALAQPGLRVQPSVEPDSLDDLPLLTWQAFGGTALRNGPYAGGQQWSLSLTLFTDDLVTGSHLADTIYQNVHDLEEADPIEGVGFLAAVDDVSMFDRVGVVALPDKRIVQYGATFTVIAIPA